jgi:branched-chain amino acid transport system permease protein
LVFAERRINLKKGLKEMHGRKYNNLIYLILIGVLFIMPILFKSNNYIILLACTIGIYIIAVSGLDILVGYSGQISLGHAAFYAIGAYSSVIINMQMGVNVWFSMLLGAIIAAIIAACIAIPSVKLVHHFLAMITIAFGEIIRVIFMNWKKVTGGHTGLMNIPSPKIGFLTFDNNFSYFYVIYIFVIFFLIVKQRIVHSRTGRALIAVRENETAANGMGINVEAYKVLAFSISAFYTGFAGALYAHFVNFISPETFTLDQSVLFLTMVLFGGAGSLMGSIIAAIMLTLISEYLQIISYYQTLVYGLFLLIIVYYFPHGLIDLFSKGKIILLKKYNKGGRD